MLKVWPVNPHPVGLLLASLSCFLVSLLKENEKKLSNIPGLKYNSKNKSLTHSDGSPLSLDSLEKLGVSEEDIQKTAKEINKKIKLAQSEFLKYSPKKTESLEEEKSLSLLEQSDELSDFLKGLRQKEEKEKEIDINSLYKNVGGERIGLKEADIFEITHRVYKKLMDEGKFYIEENPETVKEEKKGFK